MNKNPGNSQSLAASITKSASKQTYYTIRLFVNSQRIPDAYRAYAYFRWVDDVLDAGSGSNANQTAFVNRQQSLLNACYRGETPQDLCSEEHMLVDLVRNDKEINSGLKSYLDNMMEVMVFDAGRRGRIISQSELTRYTSTLAKSVTEALFYFIGGDPEIRSETRYLAVTGAHIIHMLRDTHEDINAGYYNTPQEFLQKHEISPQDMDNQATHDWVCSQIQLARGYFKNGRRYLAQVKSLRCRMAGYAYITRFEWMLRLIERDNYCLRSQYPERKSLRASLWMGWHILASLFISPWIKTKSRHLAT